MEPRMTPYRQAIMEATTCTLHDAALIEELMREQHATLDALTPKQFDTAARACQGMLTTLRVAAGPMGRGRNKAAAKALLRGLESMIR